MSTVKMSQAIKQVCRAVEAANCAAILDTAHSRGFTLCASPNSEAESWSGDVRVAVAGGIITVSLEHSGRIGIIERPATAEGLEHVCAWLTHELAY